jgi:hypothetical protein
LWEPGTRTSPRNKTGFTVRLPDRLWTLLLNKKALHFCKTLIRWFMLFTLSYDSLARRTKN